MRSGDWLSQKPRSTWKYICENLKWREVVKWSWQELKVNFRVCVFPVFSKQYSVGKYYRSMTGFSLPFLWVSWKAVFKSLLIPGCHPKSVNPLSIVWRDVQCELFIFKRRKQSRKQCRAEFSCSPRDGLASLGAPWQSQPEQLWWTMTLCSFSDSSRKAILVFSCPSFHCSPLRGILLNSHNIEQTLVFMKKHRSI